MSLHLQNSLGSGAPTHAAALGIPLLLALMTIQVECRLPPKFVLRGIERAMYGGDKSFASRLSMEQSLSRKEAYRGRRRRKRRPVNSINSYNFNKKSRGRPQRRPPPVYEYQDDVDDIGEEPGYTEDRPIRTRPWSNHLYSASIRSREPPRPRPQQDFYPRYRGKKRQPIGGPYFGRDHDRPEDFRDWNEFRDEFPPRNPDWDLEEPPWEPPVHPDRNRNNVRDEYKYYGKNPPWRENREVLRSQNFKNNLWLSGREPMQTQQVPAYQHWNDDPNDQEDIEVQVKYPVWMDDSKPDDWSEQLFPGQRSKQKFQQDGRYSKQRPALNQDLEAHVIQPAKIKNKFRSGIGQNLRAQQQKEANWELDLPYQNSKSQELMWEDPRPFEPQVPQWNEQKSGKNYQWSQKKSAVIKEGQQWEDPSKDYMWSEVTSTTGKDHWSDTSSTTSTSQAYPHWDNTQQYYHDRSLRQQPVAQPKMDSIEDDHDSTSQLKITSQ